MTLHVVKEHSGRDIGLEGAELPREAPSQAEDASHRELTMHLGFSLPATHHRYLPSGTEVRVAPGQHCS